MNFRPNQIYHVFNQGNNKQKIFFKPRNYYYFISKIKKHILPFADILAYCLMPNHFHLLLLTKDLACGDSVACQPCDKRAMTVAACRAAGAELDSQVLAEIVKGIKLPTQQQNLCHNIGQLLSSYCKAINKQEDRTGSLFKKGTIAKDGYDFKQKLHEQGLSDQIDMRMQQYWINCFNYIHQNPVKAGLTVHANDWAYSSANEYAGLNSELICNHMAAGELGLFKAEHLEELLYSV